MDPTVRRDRHRIGIVDAPDVSEYPAIIAKIEIDGSIRMVSGQEDIRTPPRAAPADNDDLPIRLDREVVCLVGFFIARSTIGQVGIHERDAIQAEAGIHGPVLQERGNGGVAPHGLRAAISSRDQYPPIRGQLHTTRTGEYLGGQDAVHAEQGVKCTIAGVADQYNVIVHTAQDKDPSIRIGQQIPPPAQGGWDHGGHHAAVAETQVQGTIGGITDNA